MNILNRKTFLGLVVSSLLINFTSQVNAEGVSNIVTVAKSGGDYTDPISAMNSIVDASADNPYLISIAPGTYSLASTLTVKPFVSITGSGQTNTKLINETTSPTLYLEHNRAWFSGYSLERSLVDASAISNLTVENSSGGSICEAIHVMNTRVGLLLEDLTAITSNCTRNNTGILFQTQAVHYAKLDNVTIAAIGGATSSSTNTGLDSYTGLIDMVGVDISVSGDTGGNVGMVSYTGAVNMLNSSIRVVGGNRDSKGLALYNVNPDDAAGEKGVRIVNSIVDISRPETSTTISSTALYMADSEVLVERSTIASDATAIDADGSSSVEGRSSTIIGEVQGGSINTCVNTDNGHGKELSATCLVME